VSETQALFATLRETADAATAAAIERLIKSGADRNLVRINVLAFAAARDLDEEHAIAAFLHAAQLGIARAGGGPTGLTRRFLQPDACACCEKADVPSADP
jgi:ATP-dependent exoDNAse (exonuclease V) alpha subunit